MTSHEKWKIQSGYKPTDQSLGVMFCVDLVAYGCCWIHPDFLLEICLMFKRPYLSLTYRHSLSWGMCELVISEYFLFHSWWFQSISLRDDWWTVHHPQFPSHLLYLEEEIAMQRCQKNNVYFYLIALYGALNDWMHFVLQVRKVCIWFKSQLKSLFTCLSIVRSYRDVTRKKN